MDITESMLKSVTFICLQKIEDGVKKNIPSGTAFIVSIPSKKHLKIVYAYLVTAKHNVEEALKVSDEVVIRINNTDDGTIDYPLPKKIRWFTHPNDITEPTDVAVIPFNILPPYKQHDFDIKAIPIKTFLTKENLNNGDIVVGNDVIVTGLFTHHHGKNKNLPIVRMGNVAMIGTEKVSVGWHNANIDAYLIEARSIGGISGSPVYFREPYFRIDEKNNTFKQQQQIKTYLAGLIHGHWPTSESEIDSIKNKTKNVNMGIAIVIPAFKIFETLMQDELEVIREQSDAEYQTTLKKE